MWIHLHLVLSYTGQHHLKAIARLSNKKFSNKWPSVTIHAWGYRSYRSTPLQSYCEAVKHKTQGASNRHNNVWSIQCITLNWKDTKFSHVTSIFVQQECEEFLQLGNMSVLPYKIFSKFILTVIHCTPKTLNVARLSYTSHIHLPCGLTDSVTLGEKWVCCAGWPDRWGNMSLLCWVTWLLGNMGLLCWVTWLLGQHEFAVLGDLTVGATWVCCAGWPDLTVGATWVCCAGWPDWWGNMGEFAVLGDLTWLLGNVGLLCWVIWQFG